MVLHEYRSDQALTLISPRSSDMMGLNSALLDPPPAHTILGIPHALDTILSSHLT